MRGGCTRIKSGQHLSRATEFKLGCVSWMATHKHTNAAKETMSLAHKGKKLTDEHKQKIGNALRGRYISLEHKRKISIAHCGMKKPWAGLNGIQTSQKRRGTNHWNWKGGISRASKTGYYSPQYKNWRRTIMVRDDFTCQNCGVKNTYIEVHHIRTWNNFPELRFNVDNGKALCRSCHKQIHAKREVKRCAH